MASVELKPPWRLTPTLPEYGNLTSNGPPPNYFRVDFFFRLLLFASAVSGLVVTSEERKVIAAMPQPFGVVARDAKFNYSPALTYLMVALAVTALYSIKTVIFSYAVMSRPAPSAKTMFGLIIFDILMASALGTAGGVAYVGLKGNSHTNWEKICSIYGELCRYTAASISLSLIALIILVLLVVLSAFSLYKRNR